MQILPSSYFEKRESQNAWISRGAGSHNLLKAKKQDLVMINKIVGVASSHEFIAALFHCCGETDILNYLN